VCSRGPLIGVEAEFFVRLGVPGAHLNRLVTIRVGYDALANLPRLPDVRDRMFPSLMSQNLPKELVLIRGFQVATTATQQSPPHLTLRPDLHACEPVLQPSAIPLACLFV